MPPHYFLRYTKPMEICAGGTIMNKIKALMKQVHANSGPSSAPFVQPSAKVKFSIPEIEEEPRKEEMIVEDVPVEPVMTAEKPKTPVAKSVKEVRHTMVAVQKDSSLPTGVLQIARDDVSVTSYGVKPVATNFNCYNKELFEWLRTFSSNNQFNGGCAITKSQLIEIVLDVIYYDLGINPIGYESQQALREDIQMRIKGMKS